MRAGVLDRLGVGWEVLHDRNPSLVYAAIRGFGDPRTASSPYAEWPAFDVIAQAMGGLVSMTGSEASGPLQAGPLVGDIFPDAAEVLAPRALNQSETESAGRSAPAAVMASSSSSE